MSGIYIPNMEMPKDGHFLQILIAENGDISYEYVSYNSPHMGFTLHKSKAIEVPPHGDLIERSEVVSCLDRHIIFNLEQDNDISAVRALSFAEADVLRDGKGIYKKFPICIPTVIEASKERENDIQASSFCLDSY